MSDCPSVNLNATVMMMAEKLAATMRGEVAPGGFTYAAPSAIRRIWNTATVITSMPLGRHRRSNPALERANLRTSPGTPPPNARE